MLQVVLAAMGKVGPHLRSLAGEIRGRHPDHDSASVRRRIADAAGALYCHVMSARRSPWMNERAQELVRYLLSGLAEGSRNFVCNGIEHTLCY